MNIFDTMTALFSGERVSHTDTFILAGVVLALFIGIRALRMRMQSKDWIEVRHLPLVEGFSFWVWKSDKRDKCLVFSHTHKPYQNS